MFQMSVSSTENCCAGALKDEYPNDIERWLAKTKCGIAYVKRMESQRRLHYCALTSFRSSVQLYNSSHYVSLQRVPVVSTWKNIYNVLKVRNNMNRSRYICAS